MANIVTGSFVANLLVPIASHPAGSLNYGPIALPAGFTEFTVMFDLQQVVSLTAIFSNQTEVSFDSGANWTPINPGALDLAQSGYVITGGILSRPAGDPKGAGPVRVFGQRINIPGCDLTTRVLRGVVSVSESLISGVTLSAV